MTKKEFMNLKVGDKVLIKKHKDDDIWAPGMDKFDGQICTVARIVKKHSCLYINEHDVIMFGYAFLYKSIEKKVDEVDEILNNEPKTLPDSVIYSEERIKQLETEIKALKEESKKNEIYKSHREAADEMMIFVKAYTDAGFTREEVMNMINNVLSKTKFTVR